MQSYIHPCFIYSHPDTLFVITVHKIYWGDMVKYIATANIKKCILKKSALLLSNLFPVIGRIIEFI